jgi:hypothetical protein
MTIVMAFVNDPARVAPGWYPDPWLMAPLRYYDGDRWTPALWQQPAYPAGGLDPSKATDRMIMPIGRTPLSIVAGYVAFFSILLVPAPISLTLGICALVQLQNRPASYGRGRAIFAVVMGAIFTPVLMGLIIARNFS